MISGIFTPNGELTNYQKTEWLIENMLPRGHRGMIATCEGGGKTTLLAWIAICVAIGKPVFGMNVARGPVLMIDEETPPQSLNKTIDRFCKGLGFKNLKEIPDLMIESMHGFRFARKNTKIMNLIESIKPVLITIDTLIASLPSGREGRGENNAETGIAVRDDLNNILKASPGCSILMTAHSGKPIMNFDIEDYRAAEMQALVRGHGSIVGEACDTGYGLKKISENSKLLRLVLFPKVRREAIPMDEIFIEMKEENYGKGWARLERIKPVPTPPTKVAVDLASLFLNGKNNQVSTQDIRNKALALYSTLEIRAGLDQLIRRKVVKTTTDRFTFKLNSGAEVDSKYVDQLLEALSN